MHKIFKCSYEKYPRVTLCTINDRKGFHFLELEVKQMHRGSYSSAIVFVYAQKILFCLIHV